MATVAKELYSANRELLQSYFPTSEHLPTYLCLLHLTPGVPQAHTSLLNICPNYPPQSLKEHLLSKTATGNLELNSFFAFT